MSFDTWWKEYERLRKLAERLNKKTKKWKVVVSSGVVKRK